MQFVLDELKEFRRWDPARVVVRDQREDIPHAKIVGNVRSRGWRILQPPIVHGGTLHQIVSQPLGRPAAKLRAAFRSHPVTHGQDGIEIVVLDRALHAAHALPSNYSEFPDSCPPAAAPSRPEGSSGAR